MSEPLEKVEFRFTPTKSGAPSIVIEYDKNSKSYEQLSLGNFLGKIKSNSMTLVVEKLELTTDGHEFYEIKVTGT